MTDCNNRTLDFARLGSQQVVADFRGGRLTTDAGALLLRETARKLGLFETLNAVIPDPRQPELITHEQQTMLAQAKRVMTAPAWPDVFASINKYGQPPCDSTYVLILLTFTTKPYIFPAAGSSRAPTLSSCR